MTKFVDFDYGNAMACEPDNLEYWKVELEKLLTDELRRVTLGEQAKQGVQSYICLARGKR